MFGDSILDVMFIDGDGVRLGSDYARRSDAAR